jgi:tetratricopeptide (TPR) repeat protein
MAPEQAQVGSSTVGPASDVYALGAILYECLTGRPPFLAASVVDVLHQLRTQEPVPPKRLQAGVPHDLETICLKCLQKEPNTRYASAAQLADDLRRFLAGEPIAARRAGVLERAAKWARRRPAAALLWLATAVAVLGVWTAGVFFGLYQEKQNRLLRQQTQQRRKASDLFSRGKDAEAAGRLALAANDEGEADKHFRDADHALAHALAVLANAEDGELAGQIIERRDQLARDRKELERRGQTRTRVARLRVDCNEVLFHAISPTGRDHAGNLAQVRKLAPAALTRFFGMGKGKDDLPVIPPSPFPLSHSREVAEACYEVLLAWAESEAETGLLPGCSVARKRHFASRALRLLDVADRLAKVQRVSTPRAYHLLRARYLAQTGNDTEASQESARAAPMRPRTALDHFLAACEHYRAGQFRQADRECSLALHEQSEHFWAQYLQALCQVKIRRWEAAKASLTACLRLRPDFLWARLLRGTVHAELEEFAAAQADFAWALEQASDPLARYVALTNRSVLWARQKRWADAAADLREAIWLKPADHEAYVNAAEVSRQQGDRRTALAAMDRAIACHPDDSTLYHTRARDLLALNDPAAQRDLEQAIALMLGSKIDAERLASAYVELGVLKHCAGKLRAALLAFDAALLVQPNHPLAYRQRADTLLKMNRYREAGAALDRYLAGGAADGRAWLVRGLIHSHLRQHSQAVEAYNRALTIEPKNTEALIRRGWAYLQLEAPRVALVDFEKALKLRKADPLALCGRGYARILLGQVADAVADAQTVLKSTAEPEQFLLVAVVFARAALLTEARRGRPDLRYEEQAVNLLCRVLRTVPRKERSTFWRTRIQPEPALAAMQKHAEVKRLLAEVR